MTRTTLRPLALLALALIALSALVPAAHASQLAASSIAGRVTRDGAGVPDASVIATRSGLIRSADTAADGSFSLAGLPDGSYSLAVRPNAITTSSPDWVFTAAPALVSVPPDAAGIELAVTPATVTVSGSVLPPAGQSLGAGSRVWVRAESQEGEGNTVLVDAQGAFSIKALPGAILIRVITENPAWDDPTAISGLIFYAEAGETVAVDGQPATGATDPIQLVLKTAAISGVVTVAGGTTPAPGIPVRAWRLDGAELEQTVTDVQGRYTLPVIPGAWMLRAVPLEAQPFVPAQPPQRVNVADGASATRDLEVAAADVIVRGRAVDSATGAPVTTLDGRVYSLYRGPNGGPITGPTAPLSDGSFTLKLASTLATTYSVGLYLPPEAGYAAQSRVTVAVASVPTSLDIPVAASNATIGGTLRDRAGAALIGVPGAVYGVGERGAWARARINPATGAYALPVTTGDLDGEGGTTWAVRAFVDPTSGYIVQRPRGQRVFVPYSGGDGVDVSGIDFTAVALADFGAVRGRVTGPGPNGTTIPLPGVRVSARPLGDSNAGPTRWDYTNASGEFELRLPAGSYLLDAHDSPLRLPTNRLVEPAPLRVSVAPRQQLSGQNLAFRVADALVSGTVSFNGQPAPAIIRARSTDGAITHARSGADGAFTLALLSSQAWTVQAVGSDQSLFLRSDKVTLTPPAGRSGPLALTLQVVDELPESQVFAFDAALDQVFTMGDGSRVEAPAGALAADGQALLTVRPLPDLPSAEGAEPIRFGYRLHAFAVGEDGRQPVTRFNRPITLVIPFTAEDLAAAGITAEQLIPAYWDEASGSWKPVETVSVISDETGGGTVQVSVEHFTDYALLGGGVSSVHLPLVRR